MPDISSPHETCDDTLERTAGQVAGECAAARLPAVLFRNPDADHGAGVVSHARRVWRVCAADHPFLSPARVSAGGADREEPEEVSRSSPAAGDPSFLEQFPDSRLCMDDHPRPERGDG